MVSLARAVLPHVDVEPAVPGRQQVVDRRDQGRVAQHRDDRPADGVPDLRGIGPVVRVEARAIADEEDPVAEPGQGEEKEKPAERQRQEDPERVLGEPE
jgi:hypothetical protein